MHVCMTRPLDCVRSDIVDDDWLSSHHSRVYGTALYRFFSKEVWQSSRANTGIRKGSSGPVLQRLEGSWLGPPRCMPHQSQGLPSTNISSRSMLGARAGWKCNSITAGSVVTDSKAVWCRLPWLSFHNRPRAQIFRAVAWCGPWSICVIQKTGQNRERARCIRPSRPQACRSWTGEVCVYSSGP